MKHSTPPNPHPEQVEITQEDRQLYALIAPDMCALIYNGDLDKFRELQAIARHRLSTTPASAGVLVEALEAQMESQDENLPSSIARERGLVWLEGWFDFNAALSTTATPASDGAQTGALEDEYYALSARADQDTGNEGEDMAALDLRDGYEQAVQTIDVLTGGGGEYRFCTTPDDSHCPDPPTMIRRIVARLTPTPDRFGEGYRAGVEASAKVAAVAAEKAKQRVGDHKGDSGAQSVAAGAFIEASEIERAIRALQPATGDEA